MRVGEAYSFGEQSWVQQIYQVHLGAAELQSYGNQIGCAMPKMVSTHSKTAVSPSTSLSKEIEITNCGKQNLNLHTFSRTHVV